MTDAFLSRSARLSLSAAPEVSGLASRWHTVLAVAFLGYTFIGLHPFEETSVAGRADGSLIDRIAVIAMFLVSVRLMWDQRSMVWRALLASWPLFLLIGFAMASIVWSDYPDLTLRRGVLLIFLTAIAMAIGLGVTDLRRFHTFLFVAMTGVILFNLAGTVISPSRSITDIGVKGVYTQKNVAGIVAMITAILGMTWTFAATSRRQVLIALGALAPTLLFLVLTRSKTSINLTAIGLAAVLFFALAERAGERFILAAGAMGLMMLASVLSVLIAIDFDIDTALGHLVGDSTFSGRDELWAFTRREAEKRFWLGHGYGAYWDVGRFNDPLVKVEPGTWLGSVEIGIINQAHHGYLELWLHIGWPATVIATVFVIYAALRGAYAAVLGPGTVEVRAALGAFAMLLMLHLLHNFTEATLFMRGSLFWSTVTLAVVILSRAKDFSHPPQSGRPKRHLS